MKILFVEDDIDVGKMYAAQLQLDGHEVETVRTAQEALDMLDAIDDFEVIVLDILLPGSNGIAVLHELQSYDDWRKIPVVVLTNVTIEDLEIGNRHLQDLGVKDYLVKMDTSPQDLSYAVATALS